MNTSAWVVAADAPAAMRSYAASLQSQLGPLVGICDGTDDHVQIQDAITALGAVGGTVTLSAGNFGIGYQISLPSKTTIEGQGFQTVLNLQSGSNTALFVINNAANVAISRIRMLGNKNQQTAGNGIDIANCIRVILDRIWLEDSKGTAVLVRGSSYVTIQGSRITGSVWRTIDVFGCLAIRIQENVFAGGGDASVAIDGAPGAPSEDIYIVSNRVTSADKAGIFVHGSPTAAHARRVHILYNTTWLNGIEGILTRGHQSFVIGNHARNNGDNGITLEWVKSGILDANISMLNAFQGAVADRCEDIAIGTNVLADNGTAGGGIFGGLRIFDSTTTPIGSKHTTVMANILRGPNKGLWEGTEAGTSDGTDYTVAVGNIIQGGSPPLTLTGPNSWAAHNEGTTDEKHA